MATTRPFNSWDALKLLGLLLMLIDHTGHFFFPDQLWIRAICRGGMPIFLFLVGFAASYRTRWDIIVIGALLSAYNIAIAGYFLPLNFLLSIACCRLMLETRQDAEYRIRKPFEWYIACVACIISVVFIQYGTIALLFALCGYMRRFATDYTLRQRQLFWLLAFITHGVTQIAFAGFSLSDSVLMTVVMIPTALLLWRFEIRPLAVSPALAAAGKWMSYRMAYLYAAHLVFFMWLTGITF